MEDDAVVEAVARERGEVLDGLRRVLGEELELDRAVVGVQRRIGHACEPTSEPSERCGDLDW